MSDKELTDGEQALIWNLIQSECMLMQARGRPEEVIGYEKVLKRIGQLGCNLRLEKEKT